ncbi:MAG: exodeoxyribonuclease V subunit gamma [Paludibacteraceae bacterium]|nr:exodeoxyribonuclease V subunit gamma [Paludibacteraceae bacterium]
MKKDSELLDDLNESQRRAVLYNEGPSLVIAGAGAGKTRVLTYKVAWLIHQGFPPESIMALTFTNKAAREMRERIAAMVGGYVARRIYMGTFHSIFGRFLRTNAECIGFTPDFTIYDTTDSKSLMKGIIKEMGLDEKQYKVSTVLNRISAAKNNLITSRSYYNDSDLMQADRQQNMPYIGELYMRYADRCKTSNAMDFDDMLLFTNILFRDHKDILNQYQDFFQFILVDEYQDTNFAQYLIVKKLAEHHHRLCVVGDDAQSIYSFRGANIDNILGFQRQYPESRIFKLEQNYRSTQTIVNAANSLIEKNRDQIRKQVYSEREKGANIAVKGVYSDLEEGFSVAKEIQALHRSDTFEDIAILYRTNAQSRVMEEAMRKTGIPYRIYGGLSFYQRKEIKDAICYLRLVLNSSDEEALKRIINVPTRGIGETTLNKVLDAAHLHVVSAWDILKDPLSYNLSVNGGTLRKLASFVQLIEPHREHLNDMDAYTLATAVIRSSGLIEDALHEGTVEGKSRGENLEELLNAIHDFTDSKYEETGEQALLKDFMSEVALQTDQDQKEGDEESEKVTMMTVHAAKGLEFKHIFIVGMEEQLFPSELSQTERELEEERRLFYVALTRAKESCHISYARSRFRNGKSNLCLPSRFISDIDPIYLDMEQSVLFGGGVEEPRRAHYYDEDWEESRSMFNGRSRGYVQSRHVVVHPKPETQQRPVGPLKKISSSATSEVKAQKEAPNGMRIGSVVEHANFGRGTIEGLSTIGNDWRATVRFENVGTKNLLLKFAKLTLLKP